MTIFYARALYNFIEIRYLEREMQAASLYIIVTGLFLQISFASAQSLQADLAYITPFEQPDVQIIATISRNFSVDPEFTLSWTIVGADSLQTRNEQQALFCYVRDSKQFLATNKWQDTYRAACTFTTYDTIVDVFFQYRDVNQGYFAFENAFTMENSKCGGSEFKKSTLSVYQTRQKHVLLRNNYNVVALTHINKGALYPDNMPCSGCCDFDLVLCYTRYYISASTGKILKGRQWINRRSIEKIVNQLDLYLIDPTETYIDRTGKSYMGKELIRMKSLSPEQFDLEGFTTGMEQHPY